MGMLNLAGRGTQLYEYKYSLPCILSFCSFQIIIGRWSLAFG